MVVLPISIHAPTRGATACEALAAKTVVFQSTLPRGERPLASVDWYQIGQFQSTLPRGERRRCCCQIWYPMAISIHAPTRGATRNRPPMGRIHRFQSTLPRGERQQFSPKSSLFSQQKLSKIFNLNNKLF